MNKIVETFYSIQGEGTHGGKAAYFIRYFGCNLACDFGHSMVCDDKAHSNKSLMKEYTDEELIATIPLECNHVVITGGEASLYDLNELIKKIQKTGVYVQVETNGTNVENIKHANFITYSPKSAFSENAPDPKLTYLFSELKLLAGVDNPVDIEKWAKVKVKYVQPIGNEHCANKANTNYCIEFVKAHPDWKLSTQLHKYLGVR